MPTLDWLNREDAFRITQRVPTRVLRPHPAGGAVGDAASGNLLIQGDNLEALKALLPFYRGRVKCIFIDPPYNTKSAFEHYDDNLEHSQWLTMMLPRLQLLRELLSEDGSIWVTIDDNEGHYLKVLMDEVFGRGNFVDTVIWQKADSPRNSARQFSSDHDYMYVYSRAPDWKPTKLERTEEANSIYTNPDNDERGPWLPGDPYANKPYSRGQYTIAGPTGRTFAPPAGRFWRVSEERLRELDEEGRIWWGPNGDARPSIKRYLTEVGNLVPRTFWTKHVTEAETGLAANALADRLIDGMGFDPLDMASMIAPQLPLDMGESSDDGPLFARPHEPLLPTLTVDLSAKLPLPAPLLEAQAAGQATVTSDGERQRVQLRGAVPEALATVLVASQRGKRREQVGQQIERHNALVSAAQAPAHRGVTFGALPRLCYRLPAEQGAQGELALLEREAVFEQIELNLLAQPVELPGFTMAEQATAWEVYLDGQKLRVGRGDSTQLPLDDVHGSLTEADLARWLSAELQHPSRNAARDVLPAHLRAFVLATVRHLVHDQRIPLEQLARHQYPLAQRLAVRIEELRDMASRGAFRQLVLDGGWAIEASAAHEFRFDPACYPVPANKRYQGKFRFSKHYYPVLADLEDGSEEWRCALAIDEHPQVRHWVRNLDSDPMAGFWLPTSFGRFYPDFVCELMDGRLFVVEYKGEHLRAVPKEIEKEQVGKLWAEHSEGRCRFAFVFKLEAGLNPTQQLDAALN